MATGSVISPKAARGHAAAPPTAAGWLPKGTARLNWRRELGLPQASWVLCSDLPRTSSRFVNKTSASAPLNYFLLRRVAVGTREKLLGGFLRGRKIRSCLSSGLHALQSPSPSAPSLALLPRRCCTLPLGAALQPRCKRVVWGVCWEEGRGPQGWDVPTCSCRKGACPPLPSPLLPERRGFSTLLKRCRAPEGGCRHSSSPWLWTSRGCFQSLHCRSQPG